jgi:ferredoxin
MKTTSVPQKKHRGKKVAVIEPWCTGCSGTPVCQVFCNRGALVLLPDDENAPFRIMSIDNDRCVGCGACVAKGDRGAVISGCPWNAIRIDALTGLAPSEHPGAQVRP